MNAKWERVQKTYLRRSKFSLHFKWNTERKKCTNPFKNNSSLLIWPLTLANIQKVSVDKMENQHFVNHSFLLLSFDFGLRWDHCLTAWQQVIVLNTWYDSSNRNSADLLTCTCFECPWKAQLHQTVHGKLLSGSLTLKGSFSVGLWRTIISKMDALSTTNPLVNSITSRCTTRLYYDLLTTPKPYRAPKNRKTLNSQVDQDKPKSMQKKFRWSNVS